MGFNGCNKVFKKTAKSTSAKNICDATYCDIYIVIVVVHQHINQAATQPDTDLKKI